MNYKDLYNNNEDFKEYVERYCKTRKILLVIPKDAKPVEPIYKDVPEDLDFEPYVDVETALSHKTVQEVGDYYNDVSASKIGG